MKFFHYTKSLNLPGIKRTGKIRRTITYFEGDRMAVWLSTNSDWDPGAGKLIQNGSDYIVPSDPVTLYKYGFKAAIPVQIEVDPSKVEIVSWQDHQRIIPGFVASRKQQGGLMLGADTSEWYVCYQDIPLSSILSIKKQIGGKWVDLPHMQQKDENTNKGELAMIIDDLNPDDSAWFDIALGGRIKIRTISSREYEKIQEKITLERDKVKIVPGQTEVNAMQIEKIRRLQALLFYDAVIVSWSGVFDDRGNLIPCTTENKIRLVIGSERFKALIDECQTKLHDRNLQRAGVVL